MQFNTLFVAAGLLAGLTSAAPQSPEQTEAAAEGIISYLSAALETDSGLASAVAAIATNTAVQESVMAWESSATAALTGSLTAIPTINFDGLPTEVRGPFSSALNAYSSGVVSVATANGFTASGLLAPTGSGSSAGAKSTGSAASGASSGASSATSKGAASSSASQAGAEPTGRALGGAAAVAMGFVGLIAAL